MEGLPEVPPHYEAEAEPKKKPKPINRRFLAIGTVLILVVGFWMVQMGYMDPFMFCCDTILWFILIGWVLSKETPAEIERPEVEGGSDSGSSED